MTSWYIGTFLPDGVTEQVSDLFREDRVRGAGRVVVVAVREKKSTGEVRQLCSHTVMIEFLLRCLCVKWNGTRGREVTRTETEMEMGNVPPEITCVSEGGGIDETVCLRVVEDGSERGVGVPDPSLYLEKRVFM